MMMRRSQPTEFGGLKIPSHLPVPWPTEHGLPSTFSIDAHVAKTERAEKKRKKIITLFSLPAVYVALFLVIRVLSGGTWGSIWTDYWLNLMGAGFLFMPAVSFLTSWTPSIFKDPQTPQLRSYARALSAWKTAVEDWNDRQLETGLGYWKEKRGIAFEAALESFFVRRGCKVSTTKGSGDGGIDLKVYADRTYWIQAKGHASSVPVTVVREIAGVCSAGGGHPVVVAVNGYTKSAAEEAARLGVILLDAHHLAQMARRERIEHISLPQAGER